MIRSCCNFAFVMFAGIGLFHGNLHAQQTLPMRRNAEPPLFVTDYIRPVQFNGDDRKSNGADSPDPAKTGAKDKAERPRTLSSWNLFKDDKEDDKNEDENKPAPLATDRPDFTENSATVGLGRIQFEMGWTFTVNRFEGATERTHTYPELLVRTGMFAEWFELRIGQNWRSARMTNLGAVTKTGGADDIYIGGRFMLAEQQKFLPEHSITYQMTLPSGGRDVSDTRILPGFNYTYSWEVSDFLNVGGSTGMNAAVDSDGSARPYSEWFTSLTTGYTLTEKLGAYAEVYALLPHGARGPDIVAQYYFDTGLQYKMTEDLAFDVRIGVGLNRHSDDFFVGSGLVFRR